MLFNTITLLSLAALAAAMPAEERCPRVRCMDAVNKCGIKYGVCYDMCTENPTPPPCPPAEAPSTTPIPTPTPTPTPTSPATPCNEDETTCVESLRVCGSPATATVTFGGCFPACGPSPTFSPPPCPVATTTFEVTPTA
ncbi:uncharacterized protein GGS25DRAFT_489038 [Hypoxylon fragiforme]|uniref:uncharacterized protein n=1 Tax=Hypoxylon fragiforme TaxID=63214 RepID=UPI0020C72D6F|nr:uncharacterized protein GGS25DRAFT_489038 [Hypoxylon fragiforme]KAI2608139.1 hypothetical protein GGS25DRAFT_489038 [Hypoxylon fragiforme]